MLFAACAQLGTPIGGPKDEFPPEIVQLSPPNQSLNFTSNRIDITFNEYLKLNNLKQQLLISPPMKETPEVSLSGKTIIIRWKEDLKPNTTYVFSFGNAITDITEGNAIPDFKYIFSTGAYLDSLQVNGKVMDAFTRQAAAGNLVLMYRLNEIPEENWDSLPALQMPDYFTRTDTAGHYSITNIREGIYKMISLEDGNANYRYDLPSEPIAFLDQTITPSDSTLIPTMIRFVPVQEHKFLKARSVLLGQVDFAFTNHADWASVELLSPSFKTDVLYTMAVSHDTLRWFFDFGEVDSLVFLVADALSPMGQSYVDTVVVKPRKSSKSTALRFSTNVQDGFLDKGDSLKIFFNTPLLSVDNSKFKLLRNSKDSLAVQSISDVSSPALVVVPFDFQFQGTYVLVVEEGAFLDIFGNSNSLDTITFKTRQETDYGSLVLSFDSTKSQSIVSLLNEQNAPIREFYRTAETTIVWEYLTGGARRVRVEEDENGNRMWDSGNYWKKIQPEKVHYYPEKIQIRPNWEIEINFNQKPEEEK